MGNVLRALKKSGAGAAPPESPLVQSVSRAVARAEQAVQEQLDHAAAEPTARPAPPRLRDPSPENDRAAPILLEPVIESPPDPAAVVAAIAAELGAPDTADADTAIARQADTPAAAVATVPRAAGSPLLVSLHEPHGAPAEQIRQLRTSMLGLGSGQAMRCMVTSFRPREGKSLTVCNLAISLSELRNKRTLLVDADLRAGRVAELFGLPEGLPGLADLLAGRCAPEQILFRTARENLQVVVAGGEEGDMLGSLLSGEPAERAVADLVEGYDYVLFDAPAVGGVADAPLIGRWATHTLLAVRMHKTPRQDVQQAIQDLANAGIPVAGVIALDDRATGRRRRLGIL